MDRPQQVGGGGVRLLNNAKDNVLYSSTTINSPVAAKSRMIRIRAGKKNDD